MARATADRPPKKKGNGENPKKRKTKAAVGPKKGNDSPETDGGSVAETIEYQLTLAPGLPVFPFPSQFAEAVVELEKFLGLPVFLLIQGGHPKISLSSFGDEAVEAVLKGIRVLPEGEPIVLLIDSPGGYAKSAFQLAEAIRQHCGSLTVAVPRYAKSAATLFALGADRLLIGPLAELGPLDAQILDPDREEIASALDEIHALERLHVASLLMVDKTMFVFHDRTGRKTAKLLPQACSFVSDLMRPLFDKIDSIHYSKMARALKVAEEYAIRLLRYNYREEDATRIAGHLVEGYPEHSFIIDAREATSFGLNFELLPKDLSEKLSSCIRHRGSDSVFGRIVQGGQNGNQEPEGDTLPKEGAPEPAKGGEGSD